MRTLDNRAVNCPHSHPPRKINLIISNYMSRRILIKIFRTDTTLDLSQKAEKGMNFHETGPRLYTSRKGPKSRIFVGSTRRERHRSNGYRRSFIVRFKFTRLRNGSIPSRTRRRLELESRTHCQLHERFKRSGGVPTNPPLFSASSCILFPLKGASKDINIANSKSCSPCRQRTVKPRKIRTTMQCGCSLLSQNHVPIGVSVCGGSKLGDEVGDLGTEPHVVHQVLGVGQVGVGVLATKVLLRTRGAREEEIWRQLSH
jgi:hypothetical protein